MHTNIESNRPAFAVLSDETLIIISGEDAITFLQGQLTSDVAALKEGEPQLSGYCNVKGRLYATFILIKEGATIRMIISADIAEIVRKRLSMFVMRAKVKLELAPQCKLFGLTTGLSVDNTNLKGINAITLLSPAAALERYLVVADANDATAATLSANGFVEMSLAQWRQRELQAGITRVSAALSEQFVPQMLNFELLGGVSFTKGCYPGQEIVARSQYLGKMKRRTFLFQIDGATDELKLGQDVISLSADSIESRVEGQVVGFGADFALVETSTETFAQVQSQGVKLSAGGVHLNAVTQPYELPVHEPVKRVL